MKQTTGYIEVNKEKIKVLVRRKKYGKSLKLRFSGEDGIFLEDESIYLSGHKWILENLLNGDVINL